MLELLEISNTPEFDVMLIRLEFAIVASPLKNKVALLIVVGPE